MAESLGAHPIHSCDDEAIKAEYRRVEANAKDWQDRFARAENEAERYHEALEQLRMGPDTLTPDGLKIVLAALYPDAFDKPETGGDHA